ncbi:MAG: MoaD/ThiS family protein [Firmicutes bacterium]|nr:MoaD/ThiS family protein [Bacillota bacterium]
MTVAFYATLRDKTGTATYELDLSEPTRLDEILRRLIAIFPALKEDLFDENGNLSHHLHLFRNGRDVRFLNALETIIEPTDTLALIPPVGGGST